jgi:hypothetical protein
MRPKHVGKETVKKMHYTEMNLVGYLGSLGSGMWGMDLIDI